MTDLLTVEIEPRGAIEIRSATVTDVRYPKREIELVVMPYDEMTVVEYHGRMIREICTRGAFDGVERRANRVKVNRDHDLARTCGRAVALHPSRDEGLVAELRISQTPLGDETLALAEDGVLDASAGFAVFPGGERWLENRQLRRLDKCWLGHIGLVPEPAYEGAQVLALRSSSPPAAGAERVPTPNLDLIRSWKLEEEWRSRFGD